MSPILQLVRDDAELPLPEELPQAEELLLRPVLVQLFRRGLALPPRCAITKCPRAKARRRRKTLELLAWERPVRQVQRRRRMNLGPLSEEERTELEELEAGLLADGLLPRPQTRADCENGIRPCPFAGCRHHVFAEILKSGAIKPISPDLDITTMDETCSLDLANRGGMEVGEVARLLNLSVASIQHIETNGKRLMKSEMEDAEEKYQRKFLPVIR